ncbi:MAG: hypothetical protein ABWY45_03465 [Mycobacterium sp.]
MTPETGAGMWCGVAAVSQVAAGLLALSVWTSAEFATDFENGTHTAGAGLPALMATVLAIVGIFCALAAIFRPEAGPIACGMGTLLLLGGCATGLLLLPLMGHYG